MKIKTQLKHNYNTLQFISSSLETLGMNFTFERNMSTHVLTLDVSDLDPCYFMVLHIHVCKLCVLMGMSNY